MPSEYAAAFFLLGGSLKDAVNVCIKQLDDFQLAIALARIVEQSDDGPILQDILNNTVVPVAFRKGNRWLASWAFWLLHRRDLSVRILVVRLTDVYDQYTRLIMVLDLQRHPCKTSRVLWTFVSWISEAHIMTIPVWLCCFLSSSQRRCRLPRARAKSQARPSSISCCK